jgi:hypothetical protein
MCKKNLLVLKPRFLGPNLGQMIWDKKNRGAIGNMLKNPFEKLGNLLGTHWEHPPQILKKKICLKKHFS